MLKITMLADEGMHFLAPCRHLPCIAFSVLAGTKGQRKHLGAFDKLLLLQFSLTKFKNFCGIQFSQQ